MAQPHNHDQEGLDRLMEQEIESINRFVDALVDFGVSYGFQILGAVVFLVIGLKLAGWTARRVIKIADAKSMDPTLARFIANVVKLLLVAFVIIITLGNFGISIAPLIALAGAVAFGATLAIQGPLANYGAGVSLILTRPFVVGNTITIKHISGVVQDITLAATVLLNEDGERVTVPNKEIVGEVIVNSREQRLIQTKIPIASEADVERAIALLDGVLAEFEQVGKEPAPQVGIHDFTYGGIVLGMRFWVPSTNYFQCRYAVNRAAFTALKSAGISLMAVGTTSLQVASLSADQDTDVPA